MAIQTLKPDAQGRVSLKKIVGEVVDYTVHLNADGSVLLSPRKKPAKKVATKPVAIPAKEKWLYANPAARTALEKGLKQAGEGKVRSLGSFARYAV